MSGPRDDSPHVRRWVQKAENDLITAEHSLTLRERCPFDMVCFHAQQCAEKYLKALLVWSEVDYPRTHDLRVLAQIVQSKTPLELDMAKLLQLNPYSVETRYPGDWEPITRAEAEHAIAIAREVRGAVRGSLPASAIQG